MTGWNVEIEKKILKKKKRKRVGFMKVGLVVTSFALFECNNLGSKYSLTNSFEVLQMEVFFFFLFFFFFFFDITDIPLRHRCR